MLRYDLRYTLQIVREQLLVIVFFFYIYSDMTVLFFPARPGVQLKMKKHLYHHKQVLLLLLLLRYETLYGL